MGISAKRFWFGQYRPELATGAAFVASIRALPLGRDEIYAIYFAMGHRSQGGVLAA
jgi:hypothetical protein